MARMDRRRRMALDEAYRYYRSLENRSQPAGVYKLVECLATLESALEYSSSGEFKLTRQLWCRLQAALFDRLITTFAGEVSVVNSSGERIVWPAAIPDEGTIEFRPLDCRRSQDVVRLSLCRLYPATFSGLKAAWKRGPRTDPRDFETAACQDGVCLARPIVVGHDVLHAESTSGRNTAYQKWWDLYWQAYCTGDKRERETIYHQMMEIESVWGNLYY